MTHSNEVRMALSRKYASPEWALFIEMAETIQMNRLDHIKNSCQTLISDIEALDDDK